MRWNVVERECNMKILFWGNMKSNMGPDNVNKCIRKNLTDTFCYVKSKNKYGELFEGVWKLLFSNALVVSGISRKGRIFIGIAKLLGKKTVYIMHGCLAYEYEINEIAPSKKGLETEQYVMKTVDLLLPVSRKFMHWVHSRYPQYVKKTKYLYNGVDKDILPKVSNVESMPNSVIAAGGNRKQKANYVVADAVESLRGQVHLEIYGGLNRHIPQDRYHHIKYMGRIPQEKFAERLSQSALFVLNSVFEPFSLAAVEALVCGCSVLLSEAAGVTDILELEETDIIHDPMNVEEVRRKIEYLLEHPNNERIMSKFNIDDWSYEKAVKRLEEFCRDLV